MTQTYFESLKTHMSIVLANRTELRQRPGLKACRSFKDIGDTAKNMWNSKEYRLGFTSFSRTIFFHAFINLSHSGQLKKSVSKSSSNLRLCLL